MVEGREKGDRERERRSIWRDRETQRKIDLDADKQTDKQTDR
jgi:hypothetical protein